MDDPFAAARRFVFEEGRLLERRLFLRLFADGPLDGVVDALAGYQNDDGGFGHGLEPDKRCPVSLPIDVETALQALVTAGAGEEAAQGGARSMLSRAADYVAGVAARTAADGAVPLAFPVIESFPRAAHWTDWTYQPALNPTAGLVGLFYALGVDHPWRSEVAAWCWAAIEAAGVPDGPHTLSEILVFLAHVPDRARADEVAAGLAQRFADTPGVHLDADAPGYGLSPLHFAPTADAEWGCLFTEVQIQTDLDHLARSQQDDGGWPIGWDPPSEASRLEWRGIVTLGALRTLTSYGRLTVTDPTGDPASESTTSSS